jgi:hypothetical protein
MDDAQAPSGVKRSCPSAPGRRSVAASVSGARRVGSAPGTAVRGRRAVGVVAHGAGGLDEVMRGAPARDLKAEAAVAHAVVRADLAVVVDGQRGADRRRGRKPRRPPSAPPRSGRWGRAGRPRGCSGWPPRRRVMPAARSSCGSRPWRRSGTAAPSVRGPPRAKRTGCAGCRERPADLGRLALVDRPPPSAYGISGCRGGCRES